MIPKPLTCNGCPIYATGQGFVPAKRGGTNGVLLVGEAGGAEEEKAGKPFVGAAGWQLKKMLTQGGMFYADFDVHNVLSCRPPNNKLLGMPYEFTATNHCHPNLEDTIKRTSPRCCVALGAIALRRLTGIQGILRARGYVHQSLLLSIPTVATYHPSYILRGNANLAQAFIYDIQHAVEVAQDGFTYDEPTYTLDPLPSTADRWADGYLDALRRRGVPLAYDIETPYTAKGKSKGLVEDDPSYTILRISFAYGEGWTISVPWRTEYLQFIEKCLGSHGDKLVWYSHYDTPRIRYNKVTISGVIHDAMVAWHVLNSDLPQSLEFVTPFFCPSFPMWKHLNKERPAWYNAADSDVLWRNYEGIERELKATGLWNVYSAHVLRLDPVLAYMSKVGMPIDENKRLDYANKLKTKMDTVLDTMRRNIPHDILKMSPKEGYVRTPKDTTGMVSITITGTELYCSRCGKVNPKKPHFRTLKTRQRDCAGLSASTRAVALDRWANVVPWIPSRTQILIYQNAKGHPLMHNGYGSKRKTTTDSKAIKKLMNAHPEDELYPLVRAYRGLQKIAGTYIGYVNE